MVPGGEGVVRMHPTLAGEVGDLDGPTRRGAVVREIENDALRSVTHVASDAEPTARSVPCDDARDEPRDLSRVESAGVRRRALAQPREAGGGDRRVPRHPAAGQPESHRGARERLAPREGALQRQPAAAGRRQPPPLDGRVARLHHAHRARAALPLREPSVRRAPRPLRPRPGGDRPELPR